MTKKSLKSDTNSKKVDADRIFSQACTEINTPEGCWHLIFKALSGKQTPFSLSWGFVWAPPKRGQNWRVKGAPTSHTQGVTCCASSAPCLQVPELCSLTQQIPFCFISWNSALYETQRNELPGPFFSFSFFSACTLMPANLEGKMCCKQREQNKLFSFHFRSLPISHFKLHLCWASQCNLTGTNRRAPIDTPALPPSPQLEISSSLPKNMLGLWHFCDQPHSLELFIS